MLAEALRKLMADDKLQRSFGKAAKKRFEEKFQPDWVMGGILEVYREAMERAKNRRKEVHPSAWTMVGENLTQQFH